jgi:hypothetical protein
VDPLHDEFSGALGEFEHFLRGHLEFATISVFRRQRHADNLPFMSAETATGQGLVFRVLDAMDAPHSGRILRLRLQSGEAPSIKSLKDAEMTASGPEGQTCRIKVIGFALFGGKPSDDRLARTGRVDLHIDEIGDGGPIGLRWEVRPV